MSDKQLPNPDDDREVDVDDAGALRTVELELDGDSPFDLEAEREHLEAVYGPFDEEEEDGDGDPDGEGALAGAEDVDPEGVEDDDEGAEDDDGSVYGSEEDNQDDPADAGAADEFDDGYDPQKASEPVRKRIDNLTRRRRLAESAKNEADQALIAERQRAQQLEQQLQSVIGRSVDAAVDTLQERRERLNEDLTNAIEAGDTARQVEIQGEMADVAAQLQLANLRQRTTPAADDGGDDPEPTRQPAGNQPTQMTPATNAWYQRNVAWFEHPKFAWANQLARQIDGEMSAEGMTHDTAYFQELDRRLVQRAPMLAEYINVQDPAPAADPDDPPKPNKKAGKRGKRKPAKSPVAPAGNGGGEGRTKVAITRADIAKMERFGLDPDKPEDVKAFAQSKLETAADFKERGHTL